MRYIRYGFWALVALCLIVLGLANREIVTLRLLPDPLAAVTGLSFAVNLPLFVAILFGVALGLMIGFVWEWLREHRYRSAARHRSREVTKLEREVDRLRTEKHEGQDEVLALLDGAAARR